MRTGSAGKRSSLLDRFRLQFRPPMKEPRLYPAFTDGGDFLVVQQFDLLEGEIVGTMLVPCLLHGAMLVRTGPQREPEPGLDLFYVERSTDPYLPGGLTAHGVYAGDRNALLVGRDGGLSTIHIHGWTFLPGYNLRSFNPDDN